MNWNLLNRVGKIISIIWTLIPISYAAFYIVLLSLLFNAFLGGSSGGGSLHIGSSIGGLGVILLNNIFYFLGLITRSLFIYGPYVIVPLNILLLIKAIKEHDSSRIKFYIIATILPVIVIIYGQQLLAAI